MGQELIGPIDWHSSGSGGTIEKGELWGRNQADSSLCYQKFLELTQEAESVMDFVLNGMAQEEICIIVNGQR